jgi:hypothetical protein
VIFFIISREIVGSNESYLYFLSNLGSGLKYVFMEAKCKSTLFLYESLKPKANIGRIKVYSAKYKP